MRRVCVCVCVCVWQLRTVARAIGYLNLGNILSLLYTLISHGIHAQQGRNVSRRLAQYQAARTTQVR
jgi:hypothetical protein